MSIGTIKYMSVHMKNDLYPKLNYHSSNSSKTPQFSNSIFSLPTSNTNDPYVFETINDLNIISSSQEFKTSGIKDGLIYLNNVDGLRFWTQILQMGQEPFTSSNFYDYYNKIPEENYILHIEIKEMKDLEIADLESDSSDPYYIAKFGEEQFKSRIIYSNLNPIFYDEFKFKIKNLDEKLIINVFDKDKLSKDDLIGTVEIDLTSEPFGKIIDKEYKMKKGSIFMKWQVTEPGQSRWTENIFNVNVLNINI